MNFLWALDPEYDPEFSPYINRQVKTYVPAFWWDFYDKWWSIMSNVNMKSGVSKDFVIHVSPESESLPSNYNDKQSYITAHSFANTVMALR